MLTLLLTSFQIFPMHIVFPFENGSTQTAYIFHRHISHPMSKVLILFFFLFKYFWRDLAWICYVKSFKCLRFWYYFETLPYCILFHHTSTNIGYWFVFFGGGSIGCKNDNPLLFQFTILWLLARLRIFKYIGFLYISFSVNCFST